MGKFEIGKYYTYMPRQYKEKPHKCLAFNKRGTPVLENADGFAFVANAPQHWHKCKNKVKVKVKRYLWWCVNNNNGQHYVKVMSYPYLDLSVDTYHHVLKCTEVEEEFDE